jgi:hypothetical protein
VSLIVKPAARWDVINAAAFYETQQAGLGADFENEVETVWRTIAAVLSVTHARARRRTWPGRLGPRNP